MTADLLNDRALEEKILLELKMRNFTTQLKLSDPQINTHEFTCGTVTGLLGVNRQNPIMYLVAIANATPHNGAFAQTMGGLEEVARHLHLRFYVIHCWNERLGTHLVAKRHYGEFNKGEHYHYQ
jgi:hypothetical protein